MESYMVDLARVAGISLRQPAMAAERNRIACHREYAAAESNNEALSAGERAYHAARAAACTAIILLSQEDAVAA